jgi:hypothetical protein
MSCLGPNYLISTRPPWYRRNTVCTDPSSDTTKFLDGKDRIYIPTLKKYVNIFELKNAFDMYKKANVLQYNDNHHTNKLTKNQKYALIAKGKWTTRKTYATQTETYTDPNNNHLKRVNYDVINANTGTPTTEPITCPSHIPKTYANTLPPNDNTPSVVPDILPIPPPKPSNNNFVLPDIVPVVNTPENKNIPDGGNLIIGTIEDICRGETKIICDFNPIICFPSSYSDVPRINGEDKELCYTKDSPALLTSNKKTTASSADGGQYATNYKGVVSANSTVSRAL